MIQELGIQVGGARRQEGRRVHWLPIQLIASVRNEVLISVRAEPVEASANPWPGSGRTVQISKGRINKRRPTTRLRSQNNCQHWVLAPHATGGYGCQQKGSIGNVAGVHLGAGLFCKPFSRSGQGYRSPSGHMATCSENAMRRGVGRPTITGLTTPRFFWGARQGELGLVFVHAIRPPPTQSSLPCLTPPLHWPRWSVSSWYPCCPTAY